MEQLQRLFGKRELIIVGSIVLLIIFLGLLSLLFSPKNQNQTATSSSSPLNSSTNTEQQAIPTISTINQFRGNTYDLSYPKDWTPDISTVTGGGTTLRLHTPGVSDDVFFPLFTLQETQVSPDADIEQRVHELATMYKLTEETITFHGLTAYHAYGPMNVEFVTGNPEQKPVEKSIMLFSGKNATYFLEYAYFADETKEKYLETVGEILDSFTLK